MTDTTETRPSGVTDASTPDASEPVEAPVPAVPEEAARSTDGEEEAANCVVALDARALGTPVSRGDRLVVFDEHGEQVWPGPDGVSALFVRGDAGLAGLGDVTVVEASTAVRPNFGGDQNVVNVVLSDVEAERFRSAGETCRLAYVLP
ncbi:hypothetical protein [Deinococcus pimensis]|uniref:hypothetical protein n=1 Tax=Deinococcus pimensis TaxID=309888 RepID=UPI0004AD522C|nr:hypothetical protein [Deinococcus pimensis]